MSATSNEALSFALRHSPLRNVQCRAPSWRRASVRHDPTLETALNKPLPREHSNLSDKYDVAEGWIYITGTQALTRLPIQQALRDKAAGLNTGGYISGYRGSPLGRYDMELWAQAQRLSA